MHVCRRWKEAYYSITTDNIRVDVRHHAALSQQFDNCVWELHARRGESYQYTSILLSNSVQRNRFCSSSPRDASQQIILVIRYNAPDQFHAQKMTWRYTSYADVAYTFPISASLDVNYHCGAKQ